MAAVAQSDSSIHRMTGMEIMASKVRTGAAGVCGWMTKPELKEPAGGTPGKERDRKIRRESRSVSGNSSSPDWHCLLVRVQHSLRAPRMCDYFLHLS